MFESLTPLGLRACFAAAPSYLTAVCACVDPAGPVVVFVVVVHLVAIFADFFLIVVGLAVLFELLANSYELVGDFFEALLEFLVFKLNFLLALNGEAELAF